VFTFLNRVTPSGVTMMTDISAYLDFVLVIFLAFGASFELPVALVILVLLGWVTPQQLRDSRGYAIVGIFVLAAVITPPDVVSQLLLALPMVALYEAGILAARAVKPTRDREASPE
jgi:sec-independent protein translocase protein TatC